MNVIAVSVYKRPEFLSIMLEHLGAQPSIENYMVHFFCDAGFNPDKTGYSIRLSTDSSPRGIFFSAS